MSTFTDWNGPQSNSVNTVLENKINKLSNDLAAHVSKTVSSDVHDINTYITKNLHSLKLAFEECNAPVSTVNDSTKPYYILGMLDSRVGTAYVKYTNTKSFSAVISYAITDTKDAEYSAHLGIVTDYASDKNNTGLDYNDLHFTVLKTTDSKGVTHLYLGLQADAWLNAETNKVYFGTVPFEVTGINLITINDESFKTPVGLVSVTTNVDYTLNQRIAKAEEALVQIGTIIGWAGDLKSIPDRYLACDGSAIPDEYTTLKKVLNSETLPLIDYHIIKAV